MRAGTRTRPGTVCATKGLTLTASLPQGRFENRMLSALKRLFKQRLETRVQIIARDPLRLTVEEFQADKNLAHLAAKTLSDPMVRQMLDTLRASHPQNAMVVNVSDAQARSIHLGRIEGYGMALNDFEALGKHKVPLEPLEAEFKDEEEKAE
jgi:hypothetical protein